MLHNSYPNYHIASQPFGKNIKDALPEPPKTSSARILPKSDGISLDQQAYWKSIAQRDIKITDDIQRYQPLRQDSSDSNATMDSGISLSPCSSLSEISPINSPDSDDNQLFYSAENVVDEDFHSPEPELSVKLVVASELKDSNFPSLPDELKIFPPSLEKGYWLDNFISEADQQWLNVTLIRKGKIAHDFRRGETVPDDFKHREWPADFFHFGLAGHGFNSNAVHYYLLTDHCALFIQRTFPLLNPERFNKEAFSKIMTQAAELSCDPLLDSLEEKLVIVDSDRLFSRIGKWKNKQLDWQLEIPNSIAHAREYL